MSNNTKKKSPMKPATKVVQQIKNNIEETTINLDDIETEKVILQHELEDYVLKDKVLGIVSNARKECYKSANLSRTQTLMLLDDICKSIKALNK